MTTNRFGISFWGDENALKFLGMDVQLCAHTKNHQTVYFKKENVWCVNNISVKLSWENIARGTSHVTLLNGKAMISITVGVTMNIYWKMYRKPWKYLYQNIKGGLLWTIRNSTLPFSKYTFVHFPNQSSQPCLYPASTPSFAGPCDLMSGSAS